MAQIRITVDAIGHGRLEINGADVSHLVSGFTLNSSVGNATKLTLEISPTMIEIDANAVATLSEIVSKNQESR